MLLPGLAFIRQHGGSYHPWIVLTDPIPKIGKVLCVNLTTLDDDCVDDECVLFKSDYPWIEHNHPTTVAFSYAQAYDAVLLDSVIRSGKVKMANPDRVPQNTLQKIRLVAKTSRELDSELKKLL